VTCVLKPYLRSLRDKSTVQVLVFRKLQTWGGKDPPTVHGGPLGYRAAESWCFRELGLGLWSPNGLRSLTELGPELLLVPVTMRWVGPEVAHDKLLAKELMGAGGGPIMAYLLSCPCV
jgi:hypothetical protein